MNAALVVVIATLVLPPIVHGQTERWVYRYTGPYGGFDRANAVVYGDDGNIYAAGESDSTNSLGDFMVISLSSGGTERWRYRFNGSMDRADEATSIVYGANGHIYAGGFMDNTLMQGKFFFIASFTPAGTYEWSYWGILDEESQANSIAYGQDGNIYGAGFGNFQLQPPDWMVLSVNDSGDENWVNVYDGSANSSDIAHSIVCGADSNLYIAGSLRDTTSSNDFIVLSLAPDSAFRWLYSYNGPANSYDCGMAVTYGADDNIYAAGYSNNSDGNEDIAVVSVTSGGTERWVYCYDGGAGEEARSIVYGDDGNIYVAGYSEDSLTLCYDFVVISLTSGGAENWVHRYDGPGNDYDEAYSLVFGADGNIYAAGYSSDSLTYEDFTVICLTPAGTEAWVYRYDGPGNTSDCALSIDYGADGNLYAAGRSGNSLSSGAFTVISIAPPTGVAGENARVSASAAMMIAPNPFSYRTTVSFELTGETDLSVRVLDATGAAVRSLAAGRRSPGYYSIDWDGRNNAGELLPSGVYFVRCEACGHTFSRQLILVR
jgi:uncharacterized delta-60 repeat protein